VATAGGGNAARVLYSTNGGATWSQGVLPAGVAQLPGLSCASPKDCVAVGSTAFENGNGIAVYTTDGGRTWTEGSLPDGTPELDGVACPSAAHCVAVGDEPFYSTDGGSTWSKGTLSAQPKPSPVVAAAHVGHSWALPVDPRATYVNCLSATGCVAVGHAAAGNEPVVLAWDGHAWSPQPAPFPAPPADGFSQVACPTSASCFAIGSSGFGAGFHQFIDHLSVGVWEMQGTPLMPAVGYSISCPTADDCWVVGYRVVSDITGAAFAEHWNGHQWLPVPVPHGTVGTANLDGLKILVSYELDSVSCPAENMCLAVGRAHSEGYGGQSFERWNGSHWQLQPVVVPTVEGGVEGIWSVSCTSTRFCMAVGGGKYLIAYRWNGAHWARASISPQTATGGYVFGPGLDDVVCISSNNCLAVGWRTAKKAALTERWNGARWNVVATPAKRDVVTCDATGHCLIS